MAGDHVGSNQAHQQNPYPLRLSLTAASPASYAALIAFAGSRCPLPVARTYARVALSIVRRQHLAYRSVRERSRVLTCSEAAAFDRAPQGTPAASHLSDNAPAPRLLPVLAFSTYTGCQGQESTTTSL